MATKDRDYDTIISGCDKLISALEVLGSAGKALSACASSAEASLKDEVGQKDVQGANEIAEAISKGVNGALSNVEELKASMQKEDIEFQKL
jgi:hypothetical protein